MLQQVAPDPQRSGAIVLWGSYSAQQLNWLKKSLPLSSTRMKATNSEEWKIALTHSQESLNSSIDT